MEIFVWELILSSTSIYHSDKDMEECQHPEKVSLCPFLICSTCMAFNSLRLQVKLLICLLSLTVFKLHTTELWLFFFFGCVGSLLLCTGFLQLWWVGATPHCGVRASYCGGFSCCGARALGARASVVVAHGLSSCGSRALEHRLSSCGTLASLLCSMRDLPRPGIEPVSPSLVGGFFFFFLILFICLFIYGCVGSSFLCEGFL